MTAFEIARCNSCKCIYLNTYAGICTVIACNGKVKPKIYYDKDLDTKRVLSKGFYYTTVAIPTAYDTTYTLRDCLKFKKISFREVEAEPKYPSIYDKMKKVEKDFKDSLAFYVDQTVEQFDKDKLQKAQQSLKDVAMFDTWAETKEAVFIAENKDPLLYNVRKTHLLSMISACITDVDSLDKWFDYFELHKEEKLGYNEGTITVENCKIVEDTVSETSESSGVVDGEVVYMEEPFF